MKVQSAKEWCEYGACIAGTMGVLLAVTAMLCRVEDAIGVLVPAALARGRCACQVARRAVAHAIGDVGTCLVKGCCYCASCTDWCVTVGVVVWL